ncbi:hypothetical protein [Vallitalea guaymasensis]|uniref:GAP1-N1 domain-containing protein n=1 Tax=Vallitalea guaymasensis TaxID=1185412 RepID=UPI000DE41ADC|nr:hypothetical protein [Vallitalea guaymasensis]
MSDTIYLDQTLHGYSEGHHMISSSIKLTNISRKKMSILSDLSGPEIKEGFKEYLTGYFLPEDNKYVLSYTWYADEMSRPGCVWTHSLIIEPDYMTMLGDNIYQVLNLFHRPNDDYNNYNNQISLCTESKKIYMNFEEKNMQYLIWAIWNENLPTIIPAYDSMIYKNELLFLWMHQNKFLNKNFAFSTGSLGIRRIESKILDLQIVPNNIINKFLGNNSGYEVVPEKEHITSFPAWVTKAYSLLHKDAWEDLNKFRYRFGNKYLRDRYFSQFIKLYIGSKANKFSFNIAEALNITQLVFDKSDDNIDDNLITLYFNNKFDKWITKDNTIEFIIYLLKTDKDLLSQNQLNKLIEQGLSNDLNSSTDIIRYLVVKGNNNISRTMLDIFSKHITLEMFKEITNLELNMCLSLIKLSPTLALCSELWYQNKEFQESILHSLQGINKNDLDINKLLLVILDTSKFDLGIDIYNLFGKQCINIYLDYLLGKRVLASNNPYILTYVCEKHKDVCLKRLKEEFKRMNSKQIIVFLNILNRDSIKTIDENFKLWLDIFYQLNKVTMTDNDELEIAISYFIFVMKSIRKYPQDIIKFVYNVINKYLSRDMIDDKYWERIECFLPKLDKDNEWDRCKRFLKAFKNKGKRVRDTKYENKDIDIHLL